MGGRLFAVQVCLTALDGTTAHLKSQVKVKGLVLLCSMNYIYSPLREHVAIIGAIQAPATKRGAPPAVSHGTGFLVLRLVLCGLHTSPVKCQYRWFPKSLCQECLCRGL